MPELFLELKSSCEGRMALEVCSGCDACGLRCAAGVPLTHAEWQEIRASIDRAGISRRQAVDRVMAQDKTVDLGDGVSVQMCRYRDMERGGCAVYEARPLICRLLGHVEWMPCPIEKVPHTLPTEDALALMAAYSEFDRKTFEEWEALDCQA